MICKSNSKSYHDYHDSTRAFFRCFFPKRPAPYCRSANNIRLNSMNYFIMEIPNKQELQQISFNHISDTDLKDFMNFYKKCTAK